MQSQLPADTKTEEVRIVAKCCPLVIEHETMLISIAELDVPKLDTDTDFRSPSVSKVPLQFIGPLGEVCSTGVAEGREVYPYRTNDLVSETAEHDAIGSDVADFAFRLADEVEDICVEV
jgi:hypothetical protein